MFWGCSHATESILTILLELIKPMIMKKKLHLEHAYHQINV